MTATSIALASLLSLSVLVLQTGERLPVSGPVEEQNGTLLFHSAQGAFFTLHASEVDLAASERASLDPAPPKSPDSATRPEALPLKASPEERQRLLAALESNHSGTPPRAQQWTITPQPEAPRNTDEEWSWRNRARDLREAITRARENLDLLEERSSALRGHIETLMAMGYKPSQFTYDTTELQTALDQIPYAELELKRAARAYDDFRDEARQRGILPGWVR